ncbi:MAG: S8 family serine peptidase [Phycisphaerae bacterium]
MNPPAVLGGQVSLAGIALTPHPFNPAVVVLYFDDLGAVPLRSLVVVVPPNTSFWPVPIQTAPVSGNVFVEVNAVLGSQIASTSLGVRRPYPVDLTVTPNPIVGGNAAVARLVFDGAGPVTGASYFPGTMTPAWVGVPDSVVLQAGQNMLEFPVVTQAVATGQTGTVEVVYDLVPPIVAQFAIVPPSIVAFDLWPTVADSPPAGPTQTTRSGLPVPARLTLDSPAPTGGLVIGLSSSGAAATVPASVTVPAGDVEANFVVQAARRANTASATITASLGASTRDATLTVLAPTLNDLSVAPKRVMGGAPVVATVQLVGLPTASGRTVTLASSAPSVASVPDSVVVPSNTDSVTFNITTTRQTTMQTVTITATSDTVRTAELTVLSALKCDSDGDGDVDPVDLAAFEPCFLGPTANASTGCRTIFDVDGLTSRIDMLDLAGFQDLYTGPGVLRRPTVRVDATVQPAVAQLAPLNGVGGPRPVGALTDHTGITVDLIRDELMVIADTPQELNTFVASWQGVVLMSRDLDDPSRPGAVVALVRVNTSLANVSDLEEDLGLLMPDVTGDLRVSDAQLLELLAIAARERLIGEIEPDINWLPKAADLSDRISNEAPTGPTGYVQNAFCWNHYNAGSVMNIAVTEAWRMLERAGRLTPSILVGVIDHGFNTSAASPNPDLPPTTIAPNPSVNARTVVPPAGWSRFHGSRVQDVLMALPDNNIGIAGTGGPVALGRIFLGPEDNSLFECIASIEVEGFTDMILNNVRIINMSYGARIPAVGSLFVGNSDFVTELMSNRAILVAAAGNDGENVDAEDCFFACWEEARHVPCEFTGVTCVGGLGVNSLAGDPGSNRGSLGPDGDVDIWAPFNVFVGPDPATPNVTQTRGTSFSSPYVAGVAALIWAADTSRTASQVRSLLLNNTQPASDHRQRKVVKADRAVSAALPLGPPPDPCVVLPVDTCTGANSPCSGGSGGPAGSIPTFPQGRETIIFFAQVRHPAGVPGGPDDVRWISDRGGLIGVGNPILSNDLAIGLHEITLQVTDWQNRVAFVPFQVRILNDEPVATIFEPANNETFCVNQVIQFTGRGSDVNQPPTFSVPDSHLRWVSNIAGVLGTGPSLGAPLAQPGTHNITLEVVDSHGGLDLEVRTINVVSTACPPPVTEVRITIPPGNTTFNSWSGYDAGRDQYYRDVTLRGWALDAEDGRLTNLTWSTNQIGFGGDAMGTLGSGQESLTVRLYGPCPGITHTITLRAVDSNGNARTAQVTITIQVAC